LSEEFDDMMFDCRRSWRRRTRMRELMLAGHQQQQLLVSRRQRGKNQMSIKITCARWISWPHT